MKRREISIVPNYGGGSPRPHARIARGVRPQLSARKGTRQSARLCLRATSIIHGGGSSLLPRKARTRRPSPQITELDTPHLVQTPAAAVVSLPTLWNLFTFAAKILHFRFYRRVECARALAIGGRPFSRSH